MEMRPHQDEKGYFSIKMDSLDLAIIMSMMVGDPAITPGCKCVTCDLKKEILQQLQEAADWAVKKQGRYTEVAQERFEKLVENCQERKMKQGKSIEEMLREIFNRNFGTNE